MEAETIAMAKRKSRRPLLQEELRKEEQKEAKTNAAAMLPIPKGRSRYFQKGEGRIVLLPSENFDYSESSLDKLKKIVLVLKKMDFSLRSEEGDSSPPTLTEVRFYNLIVWHVNSYIFLYHGEKLAAAAAARGEEEVDPGCEDYRGSNLNVFGTEGDEDEPNGFDVIDKLWDSMFQCDVLVDILMKCRSSIITSEEDPHLLDDAAAAAAAAAAADDDVFRLGKKRQEGLHHHRKQQLLDILYALEKMGQWRAYAPPQDGEEIGYYKEIRKWITSILVYVEAKVTLQRDCHSDSETAGFLSRGYPFDDNFHYLPNGHKFATALELIPEFRSLLKGCKHRLSQIFSSSSQNEQATTDDDRINMGEDDIQSAQVQQRTEAEDKRIKKTRLQCLQDILSKFNLLASLTCIACPNAQEVRLYAQIVEHVMSSLWLFDSAPAAEKIEGKRSCNLHVVDFKDRDNNSSAVPTSEGDMWTRERYLVEIVTLLEAIKSSSLATVPTLQEQEYYRKIWRMLKFNFISCSGPLDRESGEDVEGIGKMKPLAISEKVIALLKYDLMSLYKRELEFFEEVKKENAGILAVVCGSVMPEEHEAEAASSDDAFNWFIENKDQIAIKLEGFFKEPSPGRLEQLDHAVLILDEFRSLVGGVLFKLEDANRNVDNYLYLKRYKMVAREINSAHYIMPMSLGDAYPASGTI